MKKKNRNPIYIPNSYEQFPEGYIDLNGKSGKERDKEFKLQQKLALKSKK